MPRDWRTWLYQQLGPLPLIARCLFLPGRGIVRDAVSLPPSHDPMPLQGATGLGHDRALGLRLRVWMEINHDPIMCFAEFVRSLRIRKENREVPVAAPRMKDR